VVAQLTRQLPPNSTHKTRYYDLVTPAGEWMFRVTITEGKRVLKSNVYFVDTFEDHDLKANLTSVYFSRQTGEETDDRPSLYRVILNENGIPVHCTCKASVCRLQTPVTGAVPPDEVPTGAMTCKHKDVALDMAQAGLIRLREVAGHV
jgi:hypothetical protein